MAIKNMPKPPKKKMDPAAAAAAQQQKLEEEEKRLLRTQLRAISDAYDKEVNAYEKFVLERDKIQYYWIVEKKTLQEKQTDLRNKEREMEDLDERQQIELKMIQQRLKHLRYDQQDEMVELQSAAELALKLLEDQHRIAEAEFGKDKRTLKIQMKEAEIAQEEFVRMLKLENDKKILELRKEFDRKARDMQQKYELKMTTIREDMEQKRRQQIQRIDEQKNEHIQAVLSKNLRDFNEIKAYYGEVTNSNLDIIKRLKEDHADIKKRDSDQAKTMSDLEHKNKQLREPLRRATQEVVKLHDQLRAYEEDKKKLAAVKDQIRQRDTSLQRMEFQHEVLQQQYGLVTSERDELYAKFQQSMYDVQQKSGLKNLILHKKVDAIEDALETSDAQLAEILNTTTTALDTTMKKGISQKVQQVITYKNDIAAQLVEEVDRIKEAHRTMVRTYESKLAEYGVPAEELGFSPAIK